MQSDYDALFSGRLVGILDWRRFDALWGHLRSEAEGWYVRDFSSRDIPSAPLSAAAFRAWLEEAESFLRRRHREDYCGFLYADDAQAPRFIKIFDPRKMGSACGCSAKVEPRWTLSRMPPSPAPVASGGEGEQAPAPSLLARLFGFGQGAR